MDYRAYRMYKLSIVPSALLSCRFPFFEIAAEMEFFERAERSACICLRIRHFVMLPFIFKEYMR